MFIASTNGKRVGSILGVDYGDFGFIGNLIVIPEMRNKGIGRRLLKEVLNYFEKNNVACIMLDGVPAMVPLYEKLGFRIQCKSLRYFGDVIGEDYSDVVPITDDLWHTCMELDRKLFGADREKLLLQIYNDYPQLCKCLVQYSQVLGFIMAIDRGPMLKIGPWMIDPQVPHPEILIRGLFGKNRKHSIHVGVLEENIFATQSLRRLGVKSKYFSFRMVKGSKKPDFTGIFGIAGPDRG